VPEDMMARMLLSLGFVLGLLWALTWALKKYGARLGLPVVLSNGAIKHGKSRVQMINVTPLDARHRLVLVRRDNVEHLLLIGGAQPVVVETGIPHVEFRESPNEKNTNEKI
jgi:flagellar protein FliO/FliZ